MWNVPEVANSEYENKQVVTELLNQINQIYPYLVYKCNLHSW